MKKTILGVLFLLLLTCCQQKKTSIYVKQLKPVDLNDTTSFDCIKEGMINVPVTQPKKIKVSDFIEEYKYIPIETVDSSFMGQYQSVDIHENRIYIKDIGSDRACIFDINGKYINKIGRQGRGPGEFIDLNTITIDPYSNHLVAHDTFLGKLLYFTLDGEFEYAKRLPLRFMGDFRFINSNLIAFNIQREAEDNPQLKDLNKYDIIFTDSTLNVLGGVIKRNITNICGGFPSFNSNNKQVSFTPREYPRFYEFVNNRLYCKYQFNYTGYDNVFDIEKMKSLHSEKEILKNLHTKTKLLNPIFSTKRFLIFKTQYKNYYNDFYSYYDRINNKMKSFTISEIEWDSECIFESILGSYKDYIVGYVQAETLIRAKKTWDKYGIKKSKKTCDMIDNLRDDDNFVLIMFKLKPIK